MSLVYPMFSLVIFTIFIVCVLGAMRYLAVQRRQVRAGYFKTFDGERPPELLVRLSRNYNNLLEMTILFYVACVAAMALNMTSESLVLCAWGYVISRFVHSAYHIFFNVPLYRLFIFGVSVVFLLMMWILIVQQVATSQ